MSKSQLLLSFVLRYPLWAILTIVLGFLGALFNGVSITLVVPLIVAFLGDGELPKGLPSSVEKALLIFEPILKGNQLVSMTLVVFLAIFLKNIATYAGALSASYLSHCLVNDIRKDGVKMLLLVDLDFHSKTKIGDIVNRISQEVNRTATAIQIAIKIASLIMIILVFTAILILLSWKLTIISTVLLTVVMAINQYYVRRSKSFGKVLSEKSRAYSSVLLEILTGIRLIKSVSNEDYEYQRIEKLIDERERADYQSQANFAAINPVSEVMGLVAILGIVALGQMFLVKEIESVSAVLLTYLLVLLRLLPVISQLNTARSGYANAAASMEVVADFLRRDNKPVMKNGKAIYESLQKGIHFKGLSFAYPGQEELVLKQIDLWIPKGTTLALVGASGAGKSTLVDLLPRFYDPVEGGITIDGKDLREFDVRSLRRAMGIVSQDTFLFNDSIRNNIAYSRENVSDEEVRDVARRANADEFILQLPQGFDTEVGDRGVMLSGGQRQRLAIARALLSDPDILILDEATSALDTVSERLVQQAIDELCRDRTTLVIAHRLSTIQKADRIAVLEQGQVVELGTHEELLRQGGHYTRLYSMQFDNNFPHVETAVNNALIQASYQVRTRLNPMIGFLQFIVDDLVDSSEERKELVTEAYHSALRLLKTVEFIEESSKIDR